MKKIIMFFISSVLLFAITSCSNKTITTQDDSTPSITIPSEDTTSTDDSKEDEYMNKTIELKIDNQIVDVYWTDNDSVKVLKELAKDGLTINMSEYGGFEQTGLIGKTLPSADTIIDVVPGDIVLYNSNQISIFYNNSSWSYTKLGHINMSKSELKDLLDTDVVVVIFTLK
jgi:hypothetical protein